MQGVLSDLTPELDDAVQHVTKAHRGVRVPSQLKIVNNCFSFKNVFENIVS